MIAALSSLGGAGIFRQGQYIANAVFTFMVAFDNVMMPRIHRAMFSEDPEAPREIGRFLTPFCYISIGGAMGAAMLADEILLWLAPADWREPAARVVMILLMLHGLSFFTKQNQLVYRRKTGTVTALSLLNLVLAIGLNIPFIHLWGLEGAAWATLISGGLHALATFVLSQRAWRIRWESGKVLAILGLFLTADIALILSREFGAGPVADWSIKAGGLVAFAALGWWFGYLRLATLRALLRPDTKD